jgi:hypothetical protein
MLSTSRRLSCCLLICTLFWSTVVVVVDSLALHPPSTSTRKSRIGGRIHYSSKLHSNRNDNDDDSEAAAAAAANYDYIDDLTPPSINLKRDSILFSENPSTQRNNSGLDLWRASKTNLPAVLTGAWPWRDLTLADHNPAGALYNIAFVRLPIILVGLVYAKNLSQGHPLIMDVGDGPFEMSPLIVIAVLAFILA